MQIILLCSNLCSNLCSTQVAFALLDSGVFLLLEILLWFFGTCQTQLTQVDAPVLYVALYSPQRSLHMLRSEQFLHQNTAHTTHTHTDWLKIHCTRSEAFLVCTACGIKHVAAHRQPTDPGEPGLPRRFPVHSSCGTFQTK